MSDPKQDTFEGVQCCVCGVWFYVPRLFERRNREDPERLFYCPSGHQMHYKESIATGLERKLETAKNSETFWRENSARKDRSIARLKGAVNRLSRRANRRKSR